MIEKLLEFNSNFVEKKQYEKFISSKYPNKQIDLHGYSPNGIITCSARV